MSSLQVRHNAACSWAETNEINSSFVQLFKIVKKGSYKNLKHIKKDKYLKVLQSNQNWDKVLQIIANNKYEVEKDWDKPLIAKLAKVLEDDQKLRQKIGKIEERYGRDSKKAKAFWSRIMRKDSLNLIEVEAIIAKHSWLGENIVGEQGNTTFF